MVKRVGFGLVKRAIDEREVRIWKLTCRGNERD